MPLHHRDPVSVVADNATVTIVFTLCASICVSAPSCVVADIIILTIVTILCVSVSGGRNKTKNKIFIRKIKSESKTNLIVFV